MTPLRINGKSLKLKSDINSLSKFCQFVKECAEEVTGDPGIIYYVELAVDESCSNIIKYAYPDKKSGDIEVTISADEEKIELVIKDTGMPFDGRKIKDPKISKNIDERDIGGLGVYLMKNIMDETEWKRKGNENILRMVKYLPGKI